jgi:hypothetical protein
VNSSSVPSLCLQLLSLLPLLPLLPSLSLSSSFSLCSSTSAHQLHLSLPLQKKKKKTTTVEEIERQMDGSSRRHRKRPSASNQNPLGDEEEMEGDEEQMDRNEQMAKRKWKGMLVVILLAIILFSLFFFFKTTTTMREEVKKEEEEGTTTTKENEGRDEDGISSTSIQEKPTKERIRTGTGVDVTSPRITHQIVGLEEDAFLIWIRSASECLLRVTIFEDKKDSSFTSSTIEEEKEKENVEREIKRRDQHQLSSNPLPPISAEDVVHLSEKKVVQTQTAFSTVFRIPFYHFELNKRYGYFVSINGIADLNTESTLLLSPAYLPHLSNPSSIAASTASSSPSSPTSLTSSSFVPFNFVAGSCIYEGYKPFSVFRWVLERGPDFLLMIGDQIYSDYPMTIPEIQTAYERKYRDNFKDVYLSEVLRTIPTFMMWDDHELINNYDQGMDTKMYLAARSAYDNFVFPHNPTPRFPGGLFYTFSMGRTKGKEGKEEGRRRRRGTVESAKSVEDVSLEGMGTRTSTRGDSRSFADFYVMDLRSHRDPSLTTPAMNKTMLGKRQKDDLKKWLLESTAKFKVLVSSVMWNPLNRYTASGVPSDTRAIMDSWTSYRQERDEILHFLRKENISGAVLISGDSHYSGAFCWHFEEDRVSYEDDVDETYFQKKTEELLKREEGEGEEIRRKRRRKCEFVEYLVGPYAMGSDIVPSFPSFTSTSLLNCTEDGQPSGDCRRITTIGSYNETKSFGHFFFGNSAFATPGVKEEGDDEVRSDGREDIHFQIVDIRGKVRFELTTRYHQGGARNEFEVLNIYRHKDTPAPLEGETKGGGKEGQEEEGKKVARTPCPRIHRKRGGRLLRKGGGIMVTTEKKLKPRELSVVPLVCFLVFLALLSFALAPCLDVFTRVFNVKPAMPPSSLSSTYFRRKYASSPSLSQALSGPKLL